MLFIGTVQGPEAVGAVDISIDINAVLAGLNIKFGGIGREGDDLAFLAVYRCAQQSGAILGRADLQAAVGLNREVIGQLAAVFL